MYQNLRKDETSEMVAEEFLKSDLEVELDWKEVALYVHVNTTDREQKLMNIQQFMPKRVSNSGEEPGIACMGGPTKAEDEKSNC